MMFFDRRDAGRRLAEILMMYQNDPQAIVIALPRGGVVLGEVIAKKLGLTLDIICPRKIGAPFNPEFAIGAITETGEGIFSDDVIQRYNIDQDYLKYAITKEKEIAEARLKRYRKNKSPRDLKKKTVILVDDGIATGSTMMAALKTVKKEGAQKIIVAIPVGPKDTIEKFEKECEVAVLSTPSVFLAVGGFYQHFDQVEDQEVIELLEKNTQN